MVILEVGFVVVPVMVPSKKAMPATEFVAPSRRPPSGWKIMPGQVMEILFVLGGIRIFALTEIMLVVVFVLK